MVTYVKPEIDWSTFPESDGEPMAETIENATQMVDLQFAISFLLEIQGRTNVVVGGNQLMYYNPRSGLDHCSPDVYVALDVPPRPRPSWKTWEEGKFPDIVFEITSPSTQHTDLEYKRRLYARLGAREYYIYDPQKVLRPPFLGYQLVGDQFVTLPQLSAGSIVSPLLRAEFRIHGQFLRLIDPRTGIPFGTPEEERRGRLAAEARVAEEERMRKDAEEQAVREARSRRDAEEQAVREARSRRDAEERAVSEEQRRRAAEERLGRETQARLATEARITQMEAALRAARSELAQRSETPPAPE